MDRSTLLRICTEACEARSSEVPFLFLTSKSELPMRDAIAVALHRQLGERIVVREWAMNLAQHNSYSTARDRLSVGLPPELRELANKKKGNFDLAVLSRPRTNAEAPHPQMILETKQMYSFDWFLEGCRLQPGVRSGIALDVLRSRCAGEAFGFPGRAHVLVFVVDITSDGGAHVTTSLEAMFPKTYLTRRPFGLAKYMDSVAQDPTFRERTLGAIHEHFMKGIWHDTGMGPGTTTRVSMPVGGSALGLRVDLHAWLLTPG